MQFKNHLHKEADLPNHSHYSYSEPLRKSSQFPLYPSQFPLYPILFKILKFSNLSTYTAKMQFTTIVYLNCLVKAIAQDIALSSAAANERNS